MATALNTAKWIFIFGVLDEDGIDFLFEAEATAFIMPGTWIGEGEC